MKIPKKRKTLKELKEAGFCRIGETELFVNTSGIVYNRESQTTSRPRYIKTDNGQIRIEAAILLAYKNEPPQQYKSIVFADGNKNNLNPDNLKYKSLAGLQAAELNETALYEAIRKICYVDKTFKADIRQIETRLYLCIIAEKYGYIWRKTKYKEVFESYLNTFETIRQTAKRHNITVTDTSKIINGIINGITNEINQENKMILPTVQKPTYKQKLKSALAEWNKIKKELGINE